MNTENLENYEEVKNTSRTFLQVVTSDDLYYGIFLAVVALILIKLLDLIFHPFMKRGSTLASFIKGCLKVFIVVTIGMKIIALIPGLKDFTSQIFLSSSLIVMVLGFVFQEGLSNIVHGFILSVFRPFHLGDRVSMTIDGEKITGYVREINARHTVIENVLNSAHIIIPNAKMDTCMIGNNYYDGNTTSSAFLDTVITYESDLEKALKVIAETVEAHALVAQARLKQKRKENVSVLVRELGDNGISLRVPVITNTVEENFTACSDIRRSLVARFAEEADLAFAYPHMEIIQEAK